MIDPLAVLNFLPAPQLALVGSGGKTTWLYALSAAFLQQYSSVLLTTSTHLGTWQTSFADTHLVVTGQDDLATLAKNVPPGLVLVTGAPQNDGRVAGLERPILAAIQRLARDLEIPLFVEADGSRQRPLKAPAAHEPAIPETIDGVLVLAGLSGLNQPLEATWVHRPELFSILSEIPPGGRVTTTGLRKVLVSPQGGLKGIPPDVRRIVFLTQAQAPEIKSQAGSLAAALLSAYDLVMIGETAGTRVELGKDPVVALKAEIDSARITGVHQLVAGVILAAGSSTRFEGRSKQLLEWEGVPLVRHVARQAISAGLKPVYVVTGADAKAVEAALAGMPVEIVHNPAWEAGQSASIRAAVRSLSSQVGAAVFLLVDQPQIPVTLLRALVEKYRASLAPVVAPLVDGERGNPVLFDKRTFSDLEGLQGDVGGRAVFSRYRVTWVPWHDGRMRLDIDTKSDYLKLVAEMGVNPTPEDL